ncbi:MAG: TolC family protein [Deinococcales bacterium]
MTTRIATYLILALGAAWAQQTPATATPGAQPVQQQTSQQPPTTGAPQAGTTLDLAQALARAYAQGTALANAQTNLQNAQLQLTAAEADPSTLVLQKTQAQHTVALDQVTVESTKLQVLQSVASAYLALYEAQQNVALAQAQLDLADKNLAVAQAKYQDGNATALQVAQARTSQQSARQTLANAQAKVPTSAAQLATLLGVTDLGSVTVAPPPDFPQVTVALSELQNGLLERLPSVVQAKQAVDLYSLQVKLYDNDYTPRMTYQTAKTSLDNAQRTLDTARQNASTSVANAYQAAKNGYASIAIARQNLDNAKQVLAQDQAAYQAGTVAAVQVQSDQVNVASAQYSLLQAVDTYRNAVVTLSVSAGRDLTGLVQPASALGGAS